MSIIPKLAISLNRRDEVPNQELAADIVKRNDGGAVDELIANLWDKNKGIRHDCIKVVYEIGCARPVLIAPYFADLVRLLGDRDNRMQWGAMTALGCIANERPAETFAALPKIIEAADRGSVITRDNCVRIMVSLSMHPEYAADIFPLILKQLLTCPLNQLPMYAELTLPVVDASGGQRYIAVLRDRLGEMERESGRRRVEKVITKVSK